MYKLYSVFPKAIPHKERLATLHAICLQIPLQSLFRIFPHASVAQSLCGIALKNIIIAKKSVFFLDKPVGI